MILIMEFHFYFELLFNLIYSFHFQANFMNFIIIKFKYLFI